ncbi:MAG: ATP-binding cassette domain-containing protein, partial [Bilifractor porci]
MGPNGSGKSTLLKCIYRVLKPDQGAVYINRKNIAHLSYKQSAREMAVVAQKTPCLILDEPTNHLDITYQLELLDIV